MITVPKEKTVRDGVLVYAVPHDRGVLHGADCDCLHWPGDRSIQPAGTHYSMLSLQLA